MKRSGLQKLACDCGAGVYVTLAQLRKGRPTCHCGGELVPESLEVAAEVLTSEELAQHPAMILLELERTKIDRGQVGHKGPSRGYGQNLRDPYAIATERVEADRKAEARKRQLAGLVQFNPAAQVAAEIPF